MAARLTIIVALLLVLLPSAALGQEKRVPFLAVLEFAVQSNVMAIDDAVTLADMVRSRVVRPGGQVVKLISREKVIEILSKSAKSAAQCSGQCEIDTAREVGADFVITGRISPLGDKAVLVLDVKKAQDGVTVASMTVKSPVKTLDEKLDAAVDELVAELARKLGAGPTASPAEEQALKPAFGGSKVETGKQLDTGELGETVVRFSSTPSATVFLGNKMLCKQTPCQKSIALGRQLVTMSEEDYLTRTEAVEVSKATKMLDWQLQADFATLNVSCESGLALKVDGVNAGMCPLRDQRLRPGKHSVALESPCHLGAEETFEVKRGEHKDVNLPVTPRLAVMIVRARDDDNDLTGNAFLDGRAVGQVPGKFPVPVCTRRLEVRSEQHDAWSVSLQLAEGQTTEQIAQMTRSRPQRAFGLREPPTAVSRKMTGVWMMLGGAVGVTVGLVVTIVGATNSADLDTYKQPDGRYDGGRITLSSATQRQATIAREYAAGGTLLGLGVASFAVGAYLLTRDSPSVAVLPQAGGLALGGSF